MIKTQPDDMSFCDLLKVCNLNLILVLGTIPMLIAIYGILTEQWTVALIGFAGILVTGAGYAHIMSRRIRKNYIVENQNE